MHFRATPKRDFGGYEKSGDTIFLTENSRNDETTSSNEQVFSREDRNQTCYL